MLIMGLVMAALAGGLAYLFLHVDIILSHHDIGYIL